MNIKRLMAILFFGVLPTLVITEWCLYQGSLHLWAIMLLPVAYATWRFGARVALSIALLCIAELFVVGFFWGDGAANLTQCAIRHGLRLCLMVVVVAILKIIRRTTIEQLALISEPDKTEWPSPPKP